MTFPPDPIMLALAALANGTAFSIFAGHKMGVQLRPDKWIEITDTDLAELTERGWVEIDDGESGTDLPRALVVTHKGHYALRRFVEVRKCNIVLK